MIPWPESMDVRHTAPGAKTRTEAVAFAGGYGTALLLAAASVWVALRDGAEDPAGQGAALALGGAALAIVGALGLIVARRIARVARATVQSGARLHLRFVALFSVAAVIPALVVALFLGALLGRGLDAWFSQRLETIVENSASLARSYVAQAEDDIRGEAEAMAADLNQAEAVRGLVADPEAYGGYLANQAARRGFAAAYVLDGQGEPLAVAESRLAPPFSAPSALDFADAARGEVSVRLRQGEAPELLYVLMRLNDYPDAFLYVSRVPDPLIYPQLRSADQAIEDYRAAERRRDQLGAVFTLAYVVTAALVLVGAIWLGLSQATRLAAPIGRLADAAKQVAAGELSVRVAESGERDEIDALGQAFNRMTGQLAAQRLELVTARHEAESRSRFVGAVLSGVSAGVIGLDPERRITAANRSAALLLGLGSIDIVGRRLDDIAPELAALLDRPARLGAERVDLIGESGGVHLSVRRTDDPDGAGTVLTFDDMTKLVAAQRHEAWKDVARRIAHEIKNPLTPIQLSAERLRRKYADEVTSDPETFRRCTDTILRQVGDIGRMVDEFSSFARMPAAKPSPVDLAQLVRDAVFAQRLASADILVEAEGIDAPVVALVDERLLSQALANVINNAVDAVQARRARDGDEIEGRVRVRLGHASAGDQYTLEVIDNGVGFPVQDRERLLEPYVTTRAKGTGLGLAIVRRVLEDHNGRIELDDAPGPGPGALVRFVLPGATGREGADRADRKEKV